MLDGDFVPLGILPGEIAVELAENFRLQRGLHLVAHFLQGRPEVFQKNILAALPFTERFGW